MAEVKMCEKCKKREAKAFIYDGEKISQSLCLECYKTPVKHGGDIIWKKRS
jgi:hypothetical protein